ncbi:MAG: hypothetical protein KGS10_16875, partial [Chloroflexi bacterium]|nr:hypothetical protein [Chloroflexota bacterium]
MENESAAVAVEIMYKKNSLRGRANDTENALRAAVAREITIKLVVTELMWASPGGVVADKNK